MMWQDPIVAEVRRIREAYAAQFNFDLAALCQALQEQEQRDPRPHVSFPPKRVIARKDGQPAVRKPAIAG
jgi:hypothetical protein